LIEMVDSLKDKIVEMKESEPVVVNDNGPMDIEELKGNEELSENKMNTRNNSDNSDSDKSNSKKGSSDELNNAFIEEGEEEGEEGEEEMEGGRKRKRRTSK